MTPLRGTGLLIRMTVRRDRWMLPLWIGGLVAMVAATVSAFGDLYPDVASRRVFAAGIQANVVFRIFYGPLFDGATIGGLTAWRLGTFGAVLLALMSTFLVTRHTRREEETGRLELVGSAAVGRAAPLAAALSVAVATNLAGGLLCTAVLIAGSADATGAAVFGLALAGAGLVFAGVAAVAAQLAETARAANGLTIAVLAVAFLLRALGDASVGPGWVVWLSPLGWVEQTRAFAGNRTWVVVLLIAAAAVAAVAAAALSARRDMGGSLLRTRTGPARAARSLSGPFALGLRQQRGAVLGWGIAFVVLGGVFGALADSIGTLADSSPQIAEVLRRVGGPGVLLDGYFAGVLGVVALFAAGFGVAAALRLRADETGLLVEPVLSTAVSRTRLLATHLLWVLAAPAVLMLAAGAAAGSAATAALDDGQDHVSRLLAGAAVQIPAVWVVGGVALALFGLRPHWSVAAWAVLGVCAVLAEVGPVMGLPQAVLDVSPFTAVPRLVGDAAVPATPLVVLTAITMVLVAAAFTGFRRRDIG
ncbi:ABC transporter permease [Nakamurella deserti]|uniref:ABC transporter permease n=1 Tax=Nakamurella deserti TaxID=2164074 RepID=UPI00130017F6|nr:ABC transporter permease [Nakamurella deserti]